MASYYPPDSLQQKHTKTSALRSLLLHRRTPSAGVALSSASGNNVFISSPTYDSHYEPKQIPRSDHLLSRALVELPQNQQSQAPPNPAKKSREKKRPSTSGEAKIYIHKKTLSTISLKSLTRKDSDKASKSRDNESKEAKPKKVKSSTNLGKLLSRPKSAKSLRKRAAEDEARNQKDKENRSPGSTSPIDAPSRPPIYAQFSSEKFAKQPLGGKFLEDEIDLYTPKEYAPGNQQSFGDGRGRQPSLMHRNDVKQRPKSTYLPSSFSVQDISRRVSGGSARLSAEIQRRVSGGKRPSIDRKQTDTSTKSEKEVVNRGRRALAAVSGLGAKSREPEAKVNVLQDKDVDTEFEAMLDRRNIPEHQRGKMRSLAMTMKKDFIKQDWAEIDAAKNKRPGTNGSDSSADATEGTHGVPEIKSKRSRTFTLSRTGNKEPPSPTKKQRSIEVSLGRHLRTKSTESLVEKNKSLKVSGAHVAQTLIAKAKGQLPDDFVSYLRKVQNPESVEVGRLHKLRLLLRNETVAWTDEFIQKGGMAEIVGLLQRTMEVEWRFVLCLLLKHL